MQRFTDDATQRILDGLDRGRREAIRVQRARGAVYERMVRLELDRDILLGNGERGRAGRIARGLRGRITERGVRKILARLSVVPIHACDTPSHTAEDSP